jgi:transposase
MTEKLNLGGLAATSKKYTPAFKAKCVRHVAAGTRQSDVARAQGISPALLGRWQCQVLEAAVPSSAERAEIRQLRAALKCVKMERDMLKKVVTSACFKHRLSQPPPS